MERKKKNPFSCIESLRKGFVKQHLYTHSLEAKEFYKSGMRAKDL